MIKFLFPKENIISSFKKKLFVCESGYFSLQFPNKPGENQSKGHFILSSRDWKPRSPYWEWNAVSTRPRRKWQYLLDCKKLRQIPCIRDLLYNTLLPWLYRHFLINDLSGVRSPLCSLWNSDTHLSRLLFRFWKLTVGFKFKAEEDVNRYGRNDTFKCNYYYNLP